MAEVTPRRGSTIAEKIAQFRSSGAKGRSPRNTNEDAFWWQKPSPSRPDVAPPYSDAAQLPPTRSPVHGLPSPKSAQPPYESDARYRGIDQSQLRATPGRAYGASAPSAGAPASASAAALQRLAQEHPTLFNAVMSLERAADGRLSETALQMLNQTLSRSAGTSKAPAASRPGGAGGAASGPSARTTTTIVPQSPHPSSSSQQQMREEVQARAQAALAAAATAGRAAGSRAAELEAEESMGQLLARYRRTDGRAASASGSTSAAPANRPPSAAASTPLPATPQRADAPGTSASAAAAQGSTPAGATQAAPRPSSTAERTARQQGPSAAGSDAASGGGGAIAVVDAAQPQPPNKPVAEKLQKILQLANIASRMGGSPPDGPRPTSDAGAAAVAAGVSTPKPAVTGRALVSGGGAGGPASAAEGHPPPLSSEPAPPRQPDGASGRRSSRSRGASASGSSSAGDVASEPSLSSLQAQATAGHGRSGSAEIQPDAARAGAAGPTSGPAAPTEAAAREQPDGTASTAPAPVQPPEPAVHPTDDRAAMTEAARAARAAGTAASSSAELPDVRSGGSFAFPVMAGTAVDSAAMLSRAGPEPGTTTTTAATVAAAAAASAARRVQFSPNEPQVRLYSEATAAGAAAAPPGQQVGGTPAMSAAAAPGTVPGAVGPGAIMQPVFLLPSPTPPNDPNAPRPTHIFVPADPGLPPALVAVPGFEPLAPGSVKPPRRRQSPGRGGAASRSGSPPQREGQRSASPSPPRGSSSADAPADAAAAAAAAAKTAPTTAAKKRSEVDRVLDSDSDSDTDGARNPLAVELRAAEQAAAQLEKEQRGHTPNRLSRLLDQVASFRRTEGERLLREGERLKMVEELKTMNVEQLSALLGPTSELLKEISRFRDLYTGNLDQVKATADEHTRAVLDALQRTGDTAQAVKQAVVESALQQQDEVLALVDRVAPPPPPPPPLHSPLLSIPAQTLYGAAPAASELLNPSWWTQLLDPINRASLIGSVAAAAEGPSAGAVAPEAWRPPAAGPGDLLAHQVAGLASAIRASVDAGGGLGGQEDVSVSAITRAARQVSLTLDMAVREYIDRTTAVTAPAKAAVGPIPAAAATAGSPHALNAAPLTAPHLTGSVLAPAVGTALLPGPPPAAASPGVIGASQGQADPWVVQPVQLPPVLLPDGSVAQQPFTAAPAVLQPPAPVAGAAHTATTGTAAAHTLYTIQPTAPAPASHVGGGVASIQAPALTPSQSGPVVMMQSAPAAAVAGPQLVAVQGPLPAGGASGTALINLPGCGLAVGAPAEGLMPTGYTDTTLPPHFARAAQPGEGLPCRLDVQVLQMRPQPSPLPPTPQPPQQQQQQPPKLLHQPAWQQQAWHQPQQQQQPEELPVLTHTGISSNGTPADAGSRPHGGSGSALPSWVRGGAATYSGCSGGASNSDAGDGYRSGFQAHESLIGGPGAVAGSLEGHAASWAAPTAAATAAAVMGPIVAAAEPPAPSGSATPERPFPAASRRSSRSALGRGRSPGRSSCRRSSSGSGSSREGSAAGQQRTSPGTDGAHRRHRPSAFRPHHEPQSRASAAAPESSSRRPDVGGSHEGSSSGLERGGGRRRRSSGSPQSGKRAHGGEAPRPDGSAAGSLLSLSYRSSAQSSRTAAGTQSGSKRSSSRHDGSGGDCSGEGTGQQSVGCGSGNGFSFKGSELSLAAGVADLSLLMRSAASLQPHEPSASHRAAGSEGSAMNVPATDTAGERQSLSQLRRQQQQQALSAPLPPQAQSLSNHPSQAQQQQQVAAAAVPSPVSGSQPPHRQDEHPQQRQHPHPYHGYQHRGQYLTQGRDADQEQGSSQRRRESGAPSSWSQPSAQSQPYSPITDTSAAAVGAALRSRVAGAAATGLPTAWLNDSGSTTGLPTRPLAVRPLFSPPADADAADVSPLKVLEFVPAGATGTMYGIVRDMGVPGGHLQRHVPTVAVVSSSVPAASAFTFSSQVQAAAASLPEYGGLALPLQQVPAPSAFSQAAAAAAAAASPGLPWSSYAASAAYDYPNQHYQALQTAEHSQQPQQPQALKLQPQLPTEKVHRQPPAERSLLPGSPRTTAAAVRPVFFFSPPPSGYNTRAGSQAGALASVSASQHYKQQPLPQQVLPLQPSQPQSLQPPNPSTVMPIREQERQLPDVKRELVAPPVLPTLPAVPTVAGQSKEVQRAYQATLSQLQAVYHGQAQG